MIKGKYKISNDGTRMDIDFPGVRKFKGNLNLYFEAEIAKMKSIQ